MKAAAFHKAGFAGLFEVLNVTQISKAIADPRIAVTLTGSVRAGMAIGAQAGAALKKCVPRTGRLRPVHRAQRR